MEEMPVLTCSLHPKKEKDEEDIARALTPTKSIPGSIGVQNLESLVLPVLVDDRLQTTCNKSGKHDCRCEEEDTSPLSPTIRSNGERKRRRSLPCGPAESPCVTLQSAPLPSVQEYILQEIKDNINSSSLNSGGSIEMANNNRSAMRTLQNKSENRNEVRTRNNLNSDQLERWFKMQLKIEKDEGNLEKRCKRATAEEVPEIVNSKINVNRIEGSYNNSIKNLNNSGTEPGGSSEVSSTVKSGGLLDNLGSTFAPVSWSFVSSWQNSNMNSKFQSFRGAKIRFNDSEKNYKSPIFADASSHASAGPYAQPNPFHESNPGPSTYELLQKLDNSACTVHQSCSKNVNNIIAEARVSTGQDALEVNKEDNIAKNNQRKAGKRGQLWALSSSDEKDKREEGGLFDWFSKVPGRVLSVAATKGYVDGGKTKNGSLKQSEHLTGQQDTNQEIKFKNCNLELSQREVNEVLAVLRARTPSGRRRTTVKNVRKRGERPNERGCDDALEKIPTKCANSHEGIARNNSINYNVGTVRVCSLKSCEDCNRGLCKKIDHQVPEEQSSPLDRVYYDLNVYHSTHSKLTCNNTNRLNVDPRVENADRLRNVSTKADVLLGAILRTTKDSQKDLSDISTNGTRSRSTTNINNDSDDDLHSSNTDRQDHKTTPILSNDEKSLPLNKRFNRLRQLFKKEMDKRIAMMAQESPFSPESSPSYTHLSQSFDSSLRYNNEQPNLHNARNSRAKRRIDFVNFPEEIGKEKEAATMVPRLSTKDAHQNSRKTHSTNNECNNSAGLNNQNHHDRRLFEDTNEVEDGECKTARDIVAVHRKNDSISPATPQTEYSSSKVRNNNNKDDIVETGDDETVDKSVPSVLEQERFRKSLENAASMVFHSRTGLPLTSSPAPLRRGSCCFDYDSSLNSVSSKRNALFELNTPPSPGAVSLEETDREIETAGEGEETPKRRSNSRHRPQSHALLGNFEESALNGRLEPVSTVHGFTAELGASGSFCPKHQKLPVTVFFYTLGDNDKVSTPYLAHINLEKKGYQVPRNGTIQVTLLNPLGTVVKMFVVLYDLSDMPPRSHTFLRQRTLRDKTLRYLVHLRFMSSKSGRIYLHTDIRMIICRKSDVDTASDFGSEPPKELRSYIHGPTNPKFSPRC
ncbi:hypothetical protein ACFW04_009604 [Cataglyphis niger]